LGFFDILSPVLSVLNQSLEDLLPGALIILFWAFSGSCLSLGLYALISPQKSLLNIKKDIAVLKKRLNQYEDDFKVVLKLSMNLLLLSLKQVRMTIGPALIGALPMIFILIWLSNTAGYGLPENGIVKVTFYPKEIKIASVTGGVSGEEQGIWHIHWMSKKEHIRVIESSGVTVAELNSNIYIPEVRKKKWWNLFLGNLAGYINDSSKIKRIDFDFERKMYFHFGPEWMREWGVIFIFASLVFSIVIKIYFKIR
jgi:hypothetical protein